MRSRMSPWMGYPKCSAAGSRLKTCTGLRGGRGRQASSTWTCRCPPGQSPAARTSSCSLPSACHREAAALGVARTLASSSGFENRLGGATPRALDLRAWQLASPDSSSRVPVVALGRPSGGSNPRVLKSRAFG